MKGFLQTIFIFSAVLATGKFKLLLYYSPNLKVQYSNSLWDEFRDQDHMVVKGIRECRSGSTPVSIGNRSDFSELLRNPKKGTLGVKKIQNIS